MSANGSLLVRFCSGKLHVQTSEQYRGFPPADECENEWPEADSRPSRVHCVVGFRFP